jgi:hypothetical protein
MTENMQTAMVAINKWFYYAMNYRVAPIEISDYKGERTEWLPDCFNAFPKSIRGHFAEKWDALYESYGSRAVLMAFYAELDSNHRKELIKWVMENYNDEIKFSFKDEEDI